MARPFRNRGRRFSTRGPKMRLTWVTTVFNETALTLDATANEFILLDDTDWVGNVNSVQKAAHVKRVIVSGEVGWVPNQTTDEADIVALFGTLINFGTDEPDSSILVSTAGGLIQSSRVLHLEAWCKGVAETTGGFLVNNFGALATIRWDVRLNSVVRPENATTMTLQFGSTVSGAVAAASFSGYSRVLIEQP